ncbi:MAG TPA: hypothetical protein VMV50_02870 [Candidatus Paceibacterota bacterium]|nr:hypothetical protein [Candidatus Paceibacterota bacterium]
MRQDKSYIRQDGESRGVANRSREPSLDDFVLEKSIFNNIFERDIRRVFIYKKAERLAKAIHLVAPAFVESVSLRNRIDAIAVGLVDAGILPPGAARTALSRELLALSSLLSIARISGLLSNMNAELITREAHTLLQEIAAYEEPRLFLDEAPTLSGIARSAQRHGAQPRHEPRQHVQRSKQDAALISDKGHIKDAQSVSDTNIKDREEAILSVIRNKGTAGIKDISLVIRGVSEKTIQRELISLIGKGIVRKQGERRWSTYSIS